MSIDTEELNAVEIERDALRAALATAKAELAQVTKERDLLILAASVDSELAAPQPEAKEDDEHGS